MDFTKLIDRIYGEQDFARNVATSIAGAVALVVYLSTSDWVVAAIAGVILFPVAKVLTRALVRIGSEKRSSNVLEQAAQRSFARLSNDEKEVVFAFVDAGGTSLTWGRINRLGLNSSAIETLIQRDLMWASVTADGMTDTFAIDTGIFDAATSAKPKATNVLSDATNC